MRVWLLKIFMSQNRSKRVKQTILKEHTTSRKTFHCGGSLYWKKETDMDIIKEVVDFIEEHQISTAEVSDALGKTGLFENSYPLIENMHKVGLAYYVGAYGDSNWPIHYAIIDIPDDAIVVIENINCEKALFGEIVAKHMVYNCKAKAVATNGSIRDKKDIKEAKLPIWHKSVRPVGCFNSKPIYCDEEEEFVKRKKKEIDGSIVICDDDGVVIVQKEKITVEFLDKLKFIKKQEAKWKECVFEKTWNTYETICLKKYEK
jgi:regulator of RNase E activity RraA